jgi:hypothetical protein
VPLLALQEGSTSNVAGTADDAGAVITIPLTGVYNIEYGANVYSSDSAPRGHTVGVLSAQNGYMTAVDSGPSNGYGAQAVGWCQRTLNANDNIRLRYTSANGVYRMRFLRLHPVRIG